MVAGIPQLASVQLNNQPLDCRSLGTESLEDWRWDISAQLQPRNRLQLNFALTTDGNALRDIRQQLSSGGVRLEIVAAEFL